MRTQFLPAWVVLVAVAASCAPEDKCSGELIYDSVENVCRACPKESTYKNDACKCKSGYAFEDFRCVKNDDGMVDPKDAGGNEDDAGMMTGGAASCADYCSFANSCVGKNTLATAALPDIVMGLHADDQAECTDSCQSSLGNDGSTDPVVACIDAGREAAACEGKTTQASLTSALMLVADCCRPRKSNALCKSICAPFKANPLTASMADFCD